MIDFLSTCNASVTLLRRTQTTASSGTVSVSYTKVETNVPAAFNQISAATAIRYGREAELRPVILRLPPNFTLKGGDRIQWGERVFEVRGANPVVDRYGLTTALEVNAEETL